jgi:uncharacterized membrane protein (DUF4010 family)
MDQEAAFVALGIALGVGLLIGFEREQSAATENSGPGPTMGGVRTYPLVSLGGALATLLSREVGAWFVALAFAVIGVLVAISYADDVRAGRERGLTSEVAMLVAFVLGALAPTEGIIATTKDKAIVLFSIAVVVTLVLSLKPALHAIARKTTKVDIYATLKFLLAAVVLLPLLPDRPMGPMDAVNPFQTGLLIVFIAGVGFVGYVAVRVLGPGRGLGITGLVGGLVSSTAVTLAAAGRARQDPNLAPSCALSVVLANAVMAVRVLVVVAALNADLARAVAGPVAGIAACGAIASYVFWRRAHGAHGEAGELHVTNPFELISAVKLGLLITVVLFATKAASRHLGTGGVYVASALAGTTDVDAVSVSMAQMAGAETAMHVAASAILVAIAANTVTKTVIAAFVGGWAFGRPLIATSAASLAAALAGIVWLQA